MIRVEDLALFALSRVKNVTYFDIVGQINVTVIYIYIILVLLSLILLDVFHSIRKSYHIGFGGRIFCPVLGFSCLFLLFAIGEL